MSYPSIQSTRLDRGIDFIFGEILGSNSNVSAKYLSLRRKRLTSSNEVAFDLFRDESSCLAAASFLVSCKSCDKDSYRSCSRLYSAKYFATYSSHPIDVSPASVASCLSSGDSLNRITRNRLSCSFSPFFVLFFLLFPVFPFAFSFSPCASGCNGGG